MVYIVWGAIPYDRAEIYAVFMTRSEAQAYVDSKHYPGYFDNPWAVEYWFKEYPIGERRSS